ncbi:WXG100 family type VII secretion target [Dactylosporangium sp. CA-092794]|uniref:WXG100 family type VII secretion target n=1 Tax=Dactylosporangium sp. CA-092794 TaxID=3239929 RepID=UPI003D8BACB1
MADYNSPDTEIAVDPLGLDEEVGTIKTLAQSMADHIGAVVKCWADLHVSWNGESADEAADFNERWRKVMVHLYGTEGDEKSGVVNQIGQIVTIAAQNYTNVERDVRKSFVELLDALNNPAPAGGSATDDTHAPITIDY